jgi:hypothetical protein
LTVQARVSFASGEAALSLKGLPCLGKDAAIEYLAVKFALQNGAVTTVLLDRVAAIALKALIDNAELLNWDAGALRPGPIAH